MELQFQKTKHRCIKAVLHQVQQQEQTQEIRLTDGMPDVGRVVGTWGQIITRGKEWRGDTISCYGGCMVWVLYIPEEDPQPRMLDTWIPFQMKWDLPESLPEGDIRIGCRLRFADARNVSPRKILVRVGVGAMGEALVPMETDSASAEEVPSDVQLLTQTEQVRLQKEAGEKVFSMEDTLSLPGAAPAMDQLMYYSVNPQLTDKKVMTGRLVFRGNANLHMLYRGEDGQLYTWDFELPFSQLADLEGEYGTQAQSDILLGITGLELDRGEDGKVKMKCGMVAQYVVDDMESLTRVADAYSTRRPVTLQAESLEMPMLMDSNNVNIYGEQTIPGNANVVVDSQFLPDFPTLRRNENGMTAELGGQYQMLYYDDNGVLQSGTAQWENQMELPSSENANTYVTLDAMGNVNATPGAEGVRLNSDLQVRQQSIGRGELPMVTGLELGEEQEPDPGRPSLILQRAGENALWQLAKENGATMEAIRSANDLSGEPVAGQMLLIPIN